MTWGPRQRVADAQDDTRGSAGAVADAHALSVLLYDSRGVISLYLSAIHVDQRLITGTGRASVLALSLVANPFVRIARANDRASEPAAG